MRRAIRDPLDVGVRSINSLLAVGGGQRIGLFAGSGVGKSVLLGMMTRYTKADVTVVGLIGERGREVQDFVTNTLGPDGMRRAVVVATPADNPPLMRLHGAWLATAIAEYFRDRGLKVLLLLDSLTRFAQAQREIALAIGEPPATKGYPPSVFARLPQLVERAGNSDRGVGSITAFYTVLVEGDDQNDPIADAARAILDGHIVLSRRLAESGLYPAIDIEASISRAMHQISTREQLDLATRFKQVYSTYQQNRDLITVGAYRRGADPRVDTGGRTMAQNHGVPAPGHVRAGRNRAQLCGSEATRDAVLGTTGGNRPIVRAAMMKSKRFEPIQEIASSSANELSRAMAEAGRRVADLERQLEQLKTYRDEYVRNSTAERGAMDAVKLQNYRSFLDRLGEAMRQHAKNLDAARAEYEKRRAKWSEKRIEAESLGRVVERFRREEQHAADRREQREGEEAALRISLAPGPRDRQSLSALQRRSGTGSGSRTGSNWPSQYLGRCGCLPECRQGDLVSCGRAHRRRGDVGRQPAAAGTAHAELACRAGSLAASTSPTGRSSSTCRPGDLVITADIPLAAEVIAKGADALSPRGERYSPDTIRGVLTLRDFMDTMRASGNVGGGPPPLTQADRNAFASHLDKWLSRRSGN